MNAHTKYDLTLMSPLRPGLILVSVTDRRLMVYARAFVERVAARGMNSLGIPFPKLQELVSLRAGSPRSFVEARAVASRLGKPDRSAPDPKLEHVGRADFDFCRDEGIGVLLKWLQDSTPRWVVFEQPISNLLSPHLVDGLAAIRQAAQLAKSFAIAFLVEPNPAVLSQLLRLADDSLEVRTCEAELQARHSFSMHWDGASHLPELGMPATMISLKLKDGRLSVKVEPFVAKSLLSRVIWKMRASGMTYENISNEVDLHKSSVKRRLDKMPPVIAWDPPHGWLDNYREVLNLSKSESV